MPLTRLACPMLAGRIRESFSLASARIRGMAEWSKCGGARSSDVLGRERTTKWHRQLL
jgi:hypothetical protein